MVPARALALGLGCHRIRNRPVTGAPLLPEVIVIQSTLLVAIQGQFVVLAITLKVPLSSMAGSVTWGGESEYVRVERV